MTSASAGPQPELQRLLDAQRALFNQMSNRTAAAQARIRYEQARVRMSDRRIQLELTVQQALNDRRAAYRQYLAAERAVNAQQASPGLHRGTL